MKRLLVVIYRQTSTHTDADGWLSRLVAELDTVRSGALAARSGRFGSTRPDWYASPVTEHPVHQLEMEHSVRPSAGGFECVTRLSVDPGRFPPELDAPASSARPSDDEPQPPTSRATPSTRRPPRP